MEDSISKLIFESDKLLNKQSRQNRLMLVTLLCLIISTILFIYNMFSVFVFLNIFVISIMLILYFDTLSLYYDKELRNTLKKLNGTIK